MPRIIDARGLPCPQPVILVRNAMREVDEVTVLVSAQDSVDNVRRLGDKSGWIVTVERQGDAFALHLVRGAQHSEPAPGEEVVACAATAGAAAAALSPASGPAVLLVGSDTLGRGSEELGAILMRSFFHTLTEGERLPAKIVFYNTGVRLVVQGSAVLDDLRSLAERRVDILACGTCLGFFELKERVAVGTVSNMYTISETLLSASRVIAL